jgi:membrane-associated protease RseP (regulator of RpoE activity)
MVNFIVYDVFLLIVFALFVSIFLYRNKKNLKKEGLLFLYKAEWGIKLINYVGNKYQKSLKFLSYISIGLGYILMIIMIWFFGRIIWIYLFVPDVVRAIKIPPIMPLIPYLPQAFKLDFLPPFFFTYWIVILAVIAISHEFAHGIFAAYNKIKIKSTGFGFFPFFLPVFLAAFVELDEEKMVKHKKFEQMAILSAGTFANVLVAVLFLIIFWMFFSLAFTAGGVQYDSYASNLVLVSDITSVNGINLENPNYSEIMEIIGENSEAKIVVDKEEYVGIAGFGQEGEYVLLYYDAPAIKNKLGAIITEVEDVEVLNREDLSNELQKYSPGDTITIKGIDGERIQEYEIELEEFPEENGKAWLGIGFSRRQSSGILGRLTQAFTKFKDPFIYYKPKWDGISVFIYNLLWWLILISISVALVNMLPVGIFDGGRFFYLTVLGITRSERIAKKSFAFVTYLFLFLLLVLMIFWGLSFF